MSELRTGDFGLPKQLSGMYELRLFQVWIVPDRPGKATVSPQVWEATESDS